MIVPPRWVEDPVTGESITDTVEEDDSGDIVVGQAEVDCEQCGTAMEADDIFCGECGFVSRSVTRSFTTSAFTGETSVMDFGSVPGLPVDASEPEPTQEPQPAPEREHPSAPPAEFEQRPRFSFLPPPPVATAPPEAPQGPRSRPQHTFADEDDDDLEATRIVSRIPGNRFVLQFSTGESFTVHGTGLVGRNPQPEPGEYFDHLIRVLDAGRSVSKTHLEFGQEEGAFWIKDRFSGNGTVIREPGLSARRAESDRRYRLVRGTRVDIGEQFFVIS